MKKVIALLLFLLLPYAAASQIEVTSITFDPETPNPNDHVTITVRLANKGYTEDVQVTCRLFIDYDLHDVKVVPIPPRSSSAVSFLWRAEIGTHLFSVETSYYKDNTEYTDTFYADVTVFGVEEEIDYFAEAVALYNKESFIQAKIMFEQAKRVFEEEKNTEGAVSCEEYIVRCDQYVEAAQLYNQAETAFNEKDFSAALTYYQQAKSLYSILGDEKATVCEERIQQIQEEQKIRINPYYVVPVIVVFVVIALFWLRRKKQPDLPRYVPEQRAKKLFENTEQPEIVRELETIESRLDTKDPETFKLLVEDFKEKEHHFDKEEYTQKEATYVEETMEGLKGKIKEKGKRLQYIQTLKELSKRCDALLNQPVGDLVEAYNTYAQLRNAFDRLPDIGVYEQEEVKAKLTEYYHFIQEKAKSSQSETQS